MEPKVVLMKLHEQVKGMRRGWLGSRGEEGEEILLGFEIIKRLSWKRSEMVAKSR